MNKPFAPKDVPSPKVTTGALPGSRKIYSSPEGHERLRVPFREIALSSGSGEPPFRVYDTSGPYTDEDAAIDVERGLPKLRAPWIAERAVAGKPVTQLELARAGIVTEEMVFVAHRENIGRAARGRCGCGAPRRRGKLRCLAALVRDARIRAERSRARPRHHPRQYQSSRIRADDHRAEFRDQDQRQYRQLGGDVLDRGGGREDGVGDPLGRRHGHGPLHRAQHPCHARMDHPERAGADRHGADLSGAGEGGRRSGQARLGVLQGHADRAGRAGRGLFHHPCRGQARLHPPHRRSRDGNRVARRLDHGQMVPRPSPRELPL